MRRSFSRRAASRLDPGVEVSCLSLIASWHAAAGKHGRAFWEGTQLAGKNRRLAALGAKRQRPACRSEVEKADMSRASAPHIGAGNPMAAWEPRPVRT